MVIDRWIYYLIDCTVGVLVSYFFLFVVYCELVVAVLVWAKGIVMVLEVLLGLRSMLLLEIF